MVTTLGQSNFWLLPEIDRLFDDLSTLFASCGHNEGDFCLKAKRVFNSIPSETLTPAIEITMARHKARDRFPEYSNMYFSRSSLEQSSHPSLAEHHASYFKDRVVLEVGAGSAIDTIALAKVAKNVISLEADKDSASFADATIKKLNIKNVTILNKTFENFLESETLKDFSGIWSDPARRSDRESRNFNPSQYSPPLSTILDLKFDGVIGIKISPGINIDQLKLGWVREWCGNKNECTEQILWHGTDKVDGELFVVNPLGTWCPRTQKESIVTSHNLSEWKGKFLIEPHSALIRTGKLGVYFAENNIQLIDKMIAYGLSELPQKETLFLNSFKILEAEKFGVQKLQAKILEFKFNDKSDIKKRGFPEEPDTFRKKLKFSKDGIIGTIILTRKEDERIMILAERVS